MLMPKAAVYKNDSLIFRQNNIRTTGKRLVILPKAKSPCK